MAKLGLGAIGAGLTELGRGTQRIAEMQYQDEFERRRQKAQEAKEQKLMKERDRLARSRAEAESGMRSQEKVEEFERSRAKILLQAEKEKEVAKYKEGLGTSKEPKHETFRIGEARDVAGQTMENMEIKARYEKDAPDVGLGPGYVPVSWAPIKDIEAGAKLDFASKLRSDYNKEYKLYNDQEQSVIKLQDLLNKKPDAPTTHTVQNELAKLFSNQSRAIKEVTAWGNLGDLVQRTVGGLKKFTTGSLLESQYQDLKNLINDFADTTLPKFKSNLDAHYKDLAITADVSPKLVLRKSLLGDTEPTTDTTAPAPTAPKKQKGPASIEQIESDAKKYGWSEEQVNRTKSQWGFDTSTPERFR